MKQISRFSLALLFVVFAGKTFGSTSYDNFGNISNIHGAFQTVSQVEGFVRNTFGADTDPHMTRRLHEHVLDQDSRNHQAALERQRLVTEAQTFGQKVSHLITPTNAAILAGAAALVIASNYVAKEGAKHLFIKPPEIVLETSLPRTPWEYIFGVKNKYQSRKKDMVYDPEVWNQVDRLSNRVKISLYQKKPLINSLFWGAPGTGKTLAAKEIAMASGADFILINASDLLQNTTEQAILEFKQMFNYAKRNSSKKPVVVIIDEADTVFSRREKSSEKSLLLTSTFLGEVISPSNPKNLMFIFCTNRPKLDPAVLSRFGNGNKIFFSLPNLDTRAELFSKYFEKNAPRGRLDMEILSNPEFFAEKIVGWSGREIEQLSLDVAEWVESEGTRMSFDSLDEIVSLSVQNKKLLEDSKNQL